MLIAAESIDMGLESTGVLVDQLEDAELPSHDDLFLKKQEEIKAQQEAEMNNVPEDDDEIPEDDPDADAVPSEDQGFLEGTTGTVQNSSSTELRKDEEENVLAQESWYDSGNQSLQSHGLGYSTGEKHRFMTLPFWKDVLVGSGNLILRAAGNLQAGVGYTLDKIFRGSVKLRLHIANAYRSFRNRLSKHEDKIKKLNATLDKLYTIDTTLKNTEPFTEAKWFKCFFVDGKVDPLASVRRVNELLDVVTSEISTALTYDIEVIRQTIDQTSRGVRVSSLDIVKPKFSLSNFQRGSVPGYASDEDLLENFVFKKNLPCYVKLTCGLPSDKLFSGEDSQEALEQIAKAFRHSFIVLAMNTDVPKMMPRINYVDKDALRLLLGELSQVVEKAKTHLEFYKAIYKEANQLKPTYQRYLGWLTASDSKKNLNDAFVQQVYLKQSFINRVYLPAAIDIHEYCSMYLNQVLSYVESNIAEISPTKPEEDV